MLECGLVVVERTPTFRLQLLLSQYLPPPVIIPWFILKVSCATANTNIVIIAVIRIHCIASPAVLAAFQIDFESASRQLLQHQHIGNYQAYTTNHDTPLFIDKCLQGVAHTLTSPRIADDVSGLCRITAAGTFDAIWMTWTSAIGTWST